MSYQVKYEELQETIYKNDNRVVLINDNSIEIDEYVERFYSPISFNLYDDIQIVELYY